MPVPTAVPPMFISRSQSAAWASFSRCRCDRVAVGGELLAQPDRGGVLEMGAARLHDVVERRPLGQQRRRQPVERAERGGSVASMASRMAVGITSLVLCAMLT